jgi:hypothetical protein
MFELRPAEHEERKLAYSTWWQQMANLRPPHTPMGLWRRGCQDDVARVLRQSNVMVAVHVDDPSDALGVVCYSPGLLHFVYVKFHVRRHGLAHQLLATAIQGLQPDVVKFTTMPRPRFKGLVRPEWSFDPFAGTRLHYGPGPFQETRT